MTFRKAMATSAIVSSIILLVATLSFCALSPGTASSDAFIIRYCVHDINPANSEEKYLFIYSNGTAEYRLYVNSSYGSSLNTWSSVLSSELMFDAFQIMDSEGFMSLDSSYEDAGWPDSNHTERACIEASGVPHMVTFQGRSIVGVIPGSYAILNNICNAVWSNKSDIPDATLSITVTKSETEEYIAAIGANFTNNEDFELSDAGLCNVSWPTFVVSRNGTTVGDLQKSAYPMCLMTFPPQSSKDFGPWKFNYSTLPSDEYIIMSHVVIWSWVSGNFSGNPTFVPDTDEPERDPGQALDEPLILAGVAVAVAIVVLIVALSLWRNKSKAQ